MNKFFYGVIEGFYGRQWSWQVREDYAGFLHDHGFDCYIYAPKGDAFLRAQWRDNHPQEDFQQLLSLSQYYHQRGLRWGLGFSPLGLSFAYGEDDKIRLQEKINQLNALNPDILCILFDDTKGDVEGLAQRQLAIVDDILAVSEADQHIICPTYYSFDPVLEQIFGKRPAGYLETLGNNLPDSVDIFWTGNQVVSTAFTVDDIDHVARLLGRKPILWDNYPVNDGRLTSEYLHLRSYMGRPHQLAKWSAGHLVNPMNQPLISQLVLQSLPLLYKLSEAYNADTALEKGLDKLGNRTLAEKIRIDLSLFQDVGLAEMTEQQRLGLCNEYRVFNHPVADEIVEWLNGEYRFDPKCLTG
ncbi:MAG: beta-N-acetylglucosaminidase domain-containing protein [Pseudomonadales bacterium]